MLQEQIANLLKQNKSKGLGDTIEKIADKTGLSKISEAYSKTTGRDCGCNKRKKILNELFPYRNG